MNSQTENQKVQILENKKVSLVPIPRETQWGPDHTVKMSLYEGADRSYSAPKDSITGQWVKFLKGDEITAFEKALGRKEGELNFYNKENTFWRSFRVVIPNEGRVFDLADPLDNLSYRIIKEWKTKIAPSWDERNDDLRYVFAIVEEGYKEKEKISKHEKLKKAYQFYGKIEDHPEKLIHVLKVYGLNKDSDKLVSSSSIKKHDWLKNEVLKMVETDIDSFLAISQDENLDWKVLVHAALECKALEKPSKHVYALPGGEVIGKGIEQVISYLKDPENNTILTTIKARIEAAN